MRASATCALCGQAYTYPADLPPKTGMRCSSCGALIDAASGLPFGETPVVEPPGKEDGHADPRQQAALPPIKRKAGMTDHSRDNGYERILDTAAGRQESRTARPLPAASWLAWILALAAMILAATFPSYGNDSTDPLYMLQWLPTIIFGCTAAILFIQGMIAAMRR